ncbi:hypothetical protein AOXY_G4906 [Acipenser oxyrinchus oxyrinchus]|uniref:C-type lectin domain-containing protein n=1 Tax=Acipenser oxyrinchus oxyrinchus TaxID=40147 RepID=A0AAD8GDL4_ACIOX|nr:hypothetical protein AOXY_G4906 [Acipenser oxyrinchus oxyrinchus]
MWSGLTVTVLLLSAAVTPGFSTKYSTGQEFTTTFMTNRLNSLGYQNDTLGLIISAFQPDTSVSVKVLSTGFKRELFLQKEEKASVQLQPSSEQLGTQTPFSTVIIRSSKAISVLSYSNNSRFIETSVLYPVQNHGNKYYVFTQSSQNDLFSEFVIVNTNQTNEVSVSTKVPATTSGSVHEDGDIKVVLSAYESLYIQSDETFNRAQVTTQNPVALLYGCRCTTFQLAKCQQSFEQLPSITAWGTDFIVPPVLDGDGFGYVHVVTDEQQNTVYINDGSNKIIDNDLKLDFNTFSALSIRATYKVMVMFVCTGLHSGQSFKPFNLNIIPVHLFASSYLVYKVPHYNNSLLLVAESSQTDGVLLDDKALPQSVVWKKVADSNYSWADVPLGSESEHSVIQHKSARIGVYSYGILPKHGSYGYPAMSFEDYSELILVREKKTWMGAHKHCQSMQAELVSITSLSMQQKVVDLLGNVTEEGVWIGMRVSLMSGEWYWLSNEPMEYSNWGEGEPSNPFEELCGTIVPKIQRNFPWNNECCYINMPFICHKI